MENTLRWGIISTGRIAHTFANGLSRSKTGQLVAVASRTLENAQAFATEFASTHGAPTAYGSYEELLADENVQAVYIATPHTSHSEWAIKAAKAGKHILCEKPISINAAEAATVIEAARQNGVFLMEAFMYRCHPQTAKLRDLLRQKVIGEVRFVRATFSYQTTMDEEKNIFNHQLAGGGILDVGCYPVSITRLIAGAVHGSLFENPIELKGVGYIGSTRVDEYALACVKYPGNIVAEIASGVSLMLENNVRIVGSEGSILLPAPWQPAKEGGFSKIIIFREGIPEEILIETELPLYAIEADHVATQIALGRCESPAMSWDDTLGNMAALDAWRAELGHRYDWE